MMATDDDTPDLPRDAPRRVRLWWWFWRRWRLSLLVLAVLVAAYGTRPGLEDHRSTHRESLAGNDLVFMVPGSQFVTFDDYLFLTRFRCARIERFDLATNDQFMSTGQSIGLFGMVWILD